MCFCDSRTLFSSVVLLSPVLPCSDIRGAVVTAWGGREGTSIYILNSGLVSSKWGKDEKVRWDGRGVGRGGGGGLFVLSKVLQGTVLSVT